MSMRSQLGQVRGLGSAKEGSHHWWAQRLTALALVPLTIWFVASVVTMAGADYDAMREWVGSLSVTVMLVCLIIATFYHAFLGLQVVVEDYVHGEGVKIATILILKALCFLLAVAGVVSVLSIFFKG